MRACPSVDVSKRLRRLVCLSKRKKENPPTAHTGEGVRGASGELTGVLPLAGRRIVKKKMLHSPHCFPFKWEEEWDSMFSASKQNANNKTIPQLSFKKATKKLLKCKTLTLKNLQQWFLRLFASLTTLNNFTEEEHFNESRKIHKRSTNGRYYCHKLKMETKTWL